MTVEESINLEDFRFKLAFSVHSYLNSLIKYDDLSKVDWFIETVTFDGEKDVAREHIGFHKCTD